MSEKYPTKHAFERVCVAYWNRVIMWEELYKWIKESKAPSHSTDFLLGLMDSIERDNRER